MIEFDDVNSNLNTVKLANNSVLVTQNKPTIEIEKTNIEDLQDNNDYLYYESDE